MLIYDVVMLTLGHSVCCQVHGFEPYFYISCPMGMGPDDISRFHQTLEVSVLHCILNQDTFTNGVHWQYRFSLHVLSYCITGEDEGFK